MNRMVKKTCSMSIEKNNFVLSRKKNKNDYNLFERMNDAIAKRLK